MFKGDDKVVGMVVIGVVREGGGGGGVDGGGGWQLRVTDCCDVR